MRPTCRPWMACKWRTPGKIQDVKIRHGIPAGAQLSSFPVDFGYSAVSTQSNLLFYVVACAFAFNDAGSVTAHGSSRDARCITSNIACSGVIQLRRDIAVLSLKRRGFCARCDVERGRGRNSVVCIAFRSSLSIGTICGGNTRREDSIVL